MKRSFTRLHNYYFSTEGCIEGWGSGVSDRKFFKTYFEIYDAKEFFHMLNRKKINILEKQSLLLLIKNIGLQLVFFVKQRSLKFVKLCVQYSTHSVYNQPI